MRKLLSTWSRKLHRWGALLVFLPAAVVIGTGLLLQMKQQDNAISDWVQPPTQRGGATVPSIDFDRILEVAAAVPEAEIESWADIDRLDLRPDRGLVKVRSINRWEVQIDTQSGALLQVAYRRSDLIESIHDGSFFSAVWGKWVFLINGILLGGLWLTGLYLWALPHWMRYRRRRRGIA